MLGRQVCELCPWECRDFRPGAVVPDELFIKKSSQETFLETSKSIPAVPLKLRRKGRPFGFRKILSLNAGKTGRPECILSVLRLGSDGSVVSGFPAFTKRRLSGNPADGTVFVIAFFVWPILYHVHREKSNVFLKKDGFHEAVQFSTVNPVKNWEKCLLTMRDFCD